MKTGLNLILGMVGSGLYFYFSPVNEEDSSKYRQFLCKWSYVN